MRITFSQAISPRAVRPLWAAASLTLAFMRVIARPAVSLQIHRPRQSWRTRRWVHLGNPGSKEACRCTLSLRKSLIALLGLAFLDYCGPHAAQAGVQSYTVEDINDPDFLAYPPPPPQHPRTHQFTISGSPHDEVITISSTRLRNISITLENTGSTLIKAPYLYGPQGYDFRDLSKLAATITSGTGLTNAEKFFRVHEWMDEHYVRTEVSDDDPLGGMDGTLRRLNQYGGAECGEHVQIVGNLLRYVAPVGSMYARLMDLSGLHQTGEAFWDGGWHNFDAQPQTRFLYFDWDNTTIIPGWRDLKNDLQLVGRVAPWVGWDMTGYLLDAPSVDDYGVIGDVGAHFDFNYDLRPNESVTMYFDMRGRVDKTSITYDTSPWNYRTYADYGSAIFTYRPDLRSAVYQDYMTEQTNVRQTADGLIPIDPSTPASIVFPVKSVWGIAGAEITASFKTVGKVYIARQSDYLDTTYSPSITWRLLSEGKKAGYFLPSTIQGAMAYWVKFEYQGAGSGLERVEIATEVTMSPWSIPGLEYGNNHIHFEAGAMQNGSLKVTYVYDDQANHHFYEPATANYGRHIWFRVGGVLTDTFYKQAYFQKLLETPAGTEQVTLEITQVSGADAGRKVRTLIENESMPLGYYKRYWDGKDDFGNVLPPGMYAYKLIADGVPQQGARLYLFSTIWPQPNEIRYPTANTKSQTTRADFNGDGKADLLWRHALSGEMYVWLMNGAAIAASGSPFTVPDLNWKIVGVGDFDGDGKADLFWRRDGSGDTYVWFMNGLAIASSTPSFAVADPNWKVEGVGDFNGDGKADVLWRHALSGEVYVWLMNGAAIAASGSLGTVPDLNWKIVGVGASDGDGKVDVLWRHRATGQNHVWLMNGLTLSSSGSLTTVPDLDWSVQNPK